MCFHGNQHPWAIKHFFINLYSKYHSLNFICLPAMNSPVFPSLDDIFCLNKWCGVTKLLWTGGQGHTTSIHILAHPIHTHKHRPVQLQHQKCAFSHFLTRSSRTDRPADQWTDKAFYSFRVACPQLKKQGRIHGQYQLRTGGQGRKCAFSHFLTRVHGPTDQRTDGRTDGQSLL